MKLFLWTNKLLFLITQFFFASVCHHELYWPKFKQIWQELLRINKCVQHFSNTLMSTFVRLWVGHFHGFLIVPSWEFHGLLEISSPMKYMLGCNCLFRGHEMYRSKIYMRLSWPMKIHIHGFVNFSWFM